MQDLHLSPLGGDPRLQALPCSLTARQAVKLLRKARALSSKDSRRIRRFLKEPTPVKPGSRLSMLLWLVWMVQLETPSAHLH